MRRASPRLHQMARLLLEQEAEEPRDLDAMLIGSQRVCQKLAVRMGRVVGPRGYQAMLARAIKLASAEFPSLAAIQAGADGSLGGVREALNNHGDAVAALVAVLAHLLDLLATFIGDDLAARVVGEALPGAPPARADPEKR